MKRFKGAWCKTCGAAVDVSVVPIYGETLGLKVITEWEPTCVCRRCGRIPPEDVDGVTFGKDCVVDLVMEEETGE